MTHPSMLSDAGSQNRLHLPPSTNGNVMRPGNWRFASLAASSIGTFATCFAELRIFVKTS